MSPVVTSTQEPPAGLETSRTLFQLHAGSTTAFLRESQFADSRFPPELAFFAQEGAAPQNCLATQDKPTDFSSLSLLFTYVVQHETPAHQYTLYLACYHEIDDRMMARAASDPEWYKLEHGKAASPVLYAYLNKLLSDPGMAAELNAALAPSAYAARVDTGSLEKLWTAPVNKLSTNQRQSLPSTLKSDQVIPLRVSKAFLLTRESGDATRKK